MIGRCHPCLYLSSSLLQASPSALAKFVPSTVCLCLFLLQNPSCGPSHFVVCSSDLFDADRFFSLAMPLRFSCPLTTKRKPLAAVPQEYRNHTLPLSAWIEAPPVAEKNPHRYEPSAMPAGARPGAYDRPALANRGVCIDVDCFCPIGGATFLDSVAKLGRTTSTS